MQQNNSILRGKLRGKDDIDMTSEILDFLRNDELNTPVVQLLWSFLSTVVKYAPNLEDITLQDIIVAYNNWKLSEWQMASVEGFIAFASEFLQIRLGVISSCEKETSIPCSELTDAERKVIESALQERFSHMTITDFSWTFYGTTQTTQREILNVHMSDLENETWNPITDGIRTFIQKIKSNIFMKQHSPKWGGLKELKKAQNISMHILSVYWI